MRQLHALELVQNQFEMGWQRKHALQRRVAVSCALTSQNQFQPALSRLEAVEASLLNLFLSAAAERHGWAHKVPVIMEEEGAPRAWEAREEVEVKKHALE